MIWIDVASLVIGLLILGAIISVSKQIRLFALIITMAGGGIGFAAGSIGGIGWAIFGAIFGVLLALYFYSNRRRYE